MRLTLGFFDNALQRNDIFYESVNKVLAFFTDFTESGRNLHEIVYICHIHAQKYNTNNPNLLVYKVLGFWPDRVPQPLPQPQSHLLRLFR